MKKRSLFYFLFIFVSCFSWVILQAAEPIRYNITRVYLEGPKGLKCITGAVSFEKIGRGERGDGAKWVFQNTADPQGFGSVKVGDEVLVWNLGRKEYLCPTTTGAVTRKEIANCAWKISLVRGGGGVISDGDMVRLQPVDKPGKYLRVGFPILTPKKVSLGGAGPFTRLHLFSVGEVPVKEKEEVPSVAGVTAAIDLPKGFMQLPGGFAQISAGVKDGQPEIWGIGYNYGIWRGIYTPPAIGVPARWNWKFTGTQGKGVSVGSDGTVCSIGMDDRPYRWNWGSNKWEMVLPAIQLQVVAVGDAGNIWGISNRRVVKLEGDRWVLKFRFFVMALSIGGDGTAICLSSDKKIYKYTGEGQEWTSVWTLNPDQIAVGSENFWRAIKDGILFIYNPKTNKLVQSPKGRNLAYITINQRGDTFVLVKGLVREEAGMPHGFPIYYKMGMEVEAPPAVVAPGVPPKVTAAQLKQKIEAAAKMPTPSEEISALLAAVRLAKETGAEFPKPDEDQKTFVWTHLEPLHKTIGEMPPEYPDVPALFELLVEAKGCPALIGPYERYLAFWIDELAKKGVKLPPIEIKPDDTVTDLLERAAARPDLESKLASYQKIVDFWIAGATTLPPDEQTKLVWANLYPLLNGIAKLPETTEEEKKDKKELQDGLTRLLGSIKDKPNIVGPFGGLFPTVFKVEPVVEEEKPEVKPEPAPPPVPPAPPGRRPPPPPAGRSPRR